MLGLMSNTLWLPDREGWQEEVNFKFLRVNS